VQKSHQALEVTPKTNLPVRQKDAEDLDCTNARNKTALDAMDQNKQALSNWLSQQPRQRFISIKQEIQSGQKQLQVMGLRVY
jgi:hypothetical protein